MLVYCEILFNLVYTVTLMCVLKRRKKTLFSQELTWVKRKEGFELEVSWMQTKWYLDF